MEGRGERKTHAERWGWGLRGKRAMARAVISKLVK